MMPSYRDFDLTNQPLNWLDPRVVFSGGYWIRNSSEISSCGSEEGGDQAAFITASNEAVRAELEATSDYTYTNRQGNFSVMSATAAPLRLDVLVANQFIIVICIHTNP